jgi:tRNA(Ile)-lysidine synthase
VKRRRPAPAEDSWSNDEAAAPVRFDRSWLGRRLRRLLGPLRGRRLCLAYSGGLDSTVLLSALAALKSREQFSLRALHVDHRLQPPSAAWARAARSRARRLGVPCAVIAVTVRRARGESLEAAARRARYRALVDRVGADEWLLTGHHEDDQLETVLLALLRGRGVLGRSAMSALTPWAHTCLVRPLLQVSRAQLERYARSQHLQWSEDPSNLELRFDRNYVRRALLPLIRARWPGAAGTVSRSAALLSEAGDLLEQIARHALQQARDGQAVRASVLRRLSSAQRRNAVRQWISDCGLPPPDYRRLREICGPMLDARPDAVPAVRWLGGELRRHGDRLLAFAPGAHPPISGTLRWDWHARPWLPLPGGAAIGLTRDPHGDVWLGALPRTLLVRGRQGGERLPIEQGHTPLKDLLQAQGIEPWERAAVPLIMHAGRILAVADLWLDRRCRPSDPQVSERGRFRWRRAGGKNAARD